MIGFLVSQCDFVSIHAPAKGATRHGHIHGWFLHVSIHAPAKGATAASSRVFAA